MKCKFETFFIKLDITDTRFALYLASFKYTCLNKCNLYYTIMNVSFFVLKHSLVCQSAINPNAKKIF